MIIILARRSFSFMEKRLQRARNGGTKGRRKLERGRGWGKIEVRE